MKNSLWSRTVAAAGIIGVVSTGLLIAGPAGVASADTKNSADSIGWYRPSDSSWHLAFDTPPGDESDVAFVNGPANSGGIVPVSGDWDGNGSDSVAWYRYSDASWHMSNDLSGGPSDAAFVWGPAGDTSVTPIAGDWNGDGKDEVGWYRPSDGSFHLASANNGSASSSAFVWGPAGNSSVQPVTGDWNGDGKDEVGWYRPSDASFHLATANNTTASSSAFVWGIAGNTDIKVIAGDWNGDGKDTVGWYRPSDASFHLAASNTGTTDSTAFAWGIVGNTSTVPVVGDWDGKVVAQDPPSSGSLPSNPTRDQTVQYARHYLGQGLDQIRSTSSSPWSSYPNADWCAWFASWIERNNTGGVYETYAAKMTRLGTVTSSPQVRDVVIMGDYHTGILSKKVNGAWYVIDGNGGQSGPTIMTRKVIERPLWYQDGVTFVHIAY